eukprot:COSAG02_NODE_39729_length_413_cov_1.165605_1_plen_26_part_10
MRALCKKVAAMYVREWTETAERQKEM